MLIGKLPPTQTCLLTAKAGPLPPTSLWGSWPPVSTHILFLSCGNIRLWFSVCSLRSFLGPATGAGCLRGFPQWPWYTDGRAHIFVFGMTGPLNCGVCHCHFIGSICWQIFSQWGDGEVFFKVACRLKLVFRRHVSRSEVKTMFIVKTVSLVLCGLWIV